MKSASVPGSHIRVSDAEMKALNKRAVDYVYNLLDRLLAGDLWFLLESFEEADPLPQWGAPNKR